MPIRESVTIDEAVSFLNELTNIDPAAMQAFVLTRVPCNDALADHPTVQVLDGGDDGLGPKVGTLGILNGLFGTDSHGYGPIAADFIVPEKARGRVTLLSFSNRAAGIPAGSGAFSSRKEGVVRHDQADKARGPGSEQQRRGEVKEGVAGNDTVPEVLRDGEGPEV